MSLEIVLMAVGFAVASYAVVGNDALQTLGTFMASNARRPWWVLWLFALSILYAVIIYGWATSGGDAAFGRLDKIPLPERLSWIYIVPPLVLLLLTRKGIPVSTTFLVLTLFSPQSLGKMLTKSILGYLVAFVFSIALYVLVARTVERHFLETAKRPPSRAWVLLQWGATAFLWSQWLMQDLANIFAYVPRRMSLGWLLFALVVMGGLSAYTFYTTGGAIQKVVTSKTNTTDIRSATLIDISYGLVLLIFKEWSSIPMSTTWVFLGLLAGREIGVTLRLAQRPMKQTLRMVGRDGLKVSAGLAVSVVLAVGLPVAADALPQIAEAVRFERLFAQIGP